METQAKAIGQIIPQVLLARSPAQSSGKSEFLRSTEENPSGRSNKKASDAVPPSKPLRTAWQQRRFNMNSEAKGVQEMVDACQRWCRNVAARSQEKRCLIVTGPFGCGKTHALNASARFVRDVRMSVWPAPKPWGHPPSVSRVEWGALIREVVENDNRAYADDLIASDVCLIDDVGSEEDRFKSGAPVRILGDVLGALHDKRRFVFITTNIGPDGWRARWDGRVEDRLHRMDAEIVDLWGVGAQSYAAWRDSQPEGRAASGAGAEGGR